MRDHGTRARYVFGPEGQDRSQGCRCEPCKEANRAYARDRYRKAHRPDETIEPAYVPCHEARRHLEWLRSVGVGYRTVSERTGIARSSLQKIGTGRVTRSRRSTIDAILAVPRSAARPGAYVPADDTWRRIDDLLAHGWTKVAIARHLTGNPDAVALQLGRDRVTRAHADAVRDLHESALLPVIRQREIDRDRQRAHRAGRTAA